MSYNTSNSYIPSSALSTADTESFVLAPPVDPRHAPPPELVADRTESEAARQHGWLRHCASFSTSLIVHALLLVILGYVVLTTTPPKSHVLTVLTGEEADEPPLFDIAVTLPNLADASVPPGSPLNNEPVPVESVQVTAVTSQARQHDSLDHTGRLTDVAAKTLQQLAHAPVGGGFQGRASSRRATLVRERGGTLESEEAVERALVWLAAHQRHDGSWRLDHQKGPCLGRCPHPGTVKTSTGATGLALLPFLGAGYTHRQGKYDDVVNRGLYYLTRRMKRTEHGGDLMEGTMYAHGIATLALCEAYAMTGDAELREPAQAAIDFIGYAQHEQGGWRYFPNEPGDTTVTGWQVMALKSGRLAELYVPSYTTAMVRKYLDTVQDPGGVFHGYMEPNKQPGPTSVALLLRMYLSWPRDDERLERGVDYLSSRGPSKTDMYFNYYATQVLHHYEGEAWRRWNARMRDYLVDTQSRREHQAGSWYFPDRHGTAGGRLYTTAICAMTLEVYYRHMPLYGTAAIEDEL